MSENKKYNCLIIDDEPLARQLIQTHVQNIPELNVLMEFSSAIEAKRYLETNTVDLIFLDIQMPELSGIDFIKSLQNPPKIILTTAYSEFAIEGYELNVIDYLLKPITFERFRKAVLKTIEVLKLEEGSNNLSTGKLSQESILIKSKHQLIKVQISDILYIESMHKYIKIFTSENTYTTLFSITTIEKKLPNNQFYRCHRSFIINLNKVKLIDGNKAVLQKNSVPIGKNNKAELISKLGKKI